MTDQANSGGEEPVVRGFLSDAAAVRPSPSDPEVEVAADATVRPYAITGGRTTTSNSAVRFESILVATDAGRAIAERLSPELVMILTEANRPRSVVEIAHRAGLPLGVVLVLAGDAVSDGYLRSSSASAIDKSFVTRVREAVHAL